MNGRRECRSILGARFGTAPAAAGSSDSLAGTKMARPIGSDGRGQAACQLGHPVGHRAGQRPRRLTGGDSGARCGAVAAARNGGHKSAARES